MTLDEQLDDLGAKVDRVMAERDELLSMLRRLVGTYVPEHGWGNLFAEANRLLARIEETR